ncbi:MAG: hypothetical protein IJW21_04035 [Clostridia bacterium]|nr:hypothetical protein [Clostridia bacterium]
MKRAIALLMALIMVMCMVAACGESTTGTTATTQTTNTTANPENTNSTGTTATTEGTTATSATTKPAATTKPPTVSPPADGAPQEDPSRKPILWLDFEPENIEGNTIKNAVGGGLDATITGNPQYMTSPTGGSAIHFGQSTVFDYLTIANDERINFNIDDEFTIDFWYMLDRNAAGWDNLFSKGSSKNGWYGVWLGTSDATNQGVCWGGDTGNHKIGSMYSKYVWHHITVVQKSGMLVMYLNGKQVNSVSSVDCNSTTDLFLGGRNSSDATAIATAQFHGAIDDFKIYDYAWDIEAELKPIYSAKAYTFEYVSEDVESKITLPYRVYYPTDYATSGKDYPVLFFLHGHGECGTDNGKQLQVFGPNVLLDDVAAMDNCIIVAPQTVCDGATNKYEWVASGVGAQAGRHVWDTGMPIRGGTLDETIHTVGMQAAETLLYDFLENNRVDMNRIYVGGISMGGCATWEILARNPELFAAAIPICGSGILSTAASLVNVDIWAFHGTSDPTVLPEGTAKMVEAITAAGGTKAIYTPLAGQGHSIWNPAYTYKNAEGQTPAQWLLQQTKAD